ncbi:heme lyase NrfEFG subunit NrfE, partial [Marinobacter salarius]|uniref:cytochrome c-type biogenesis CcmF C-terminal domain-containing protein n=2 Tax=Marinobacter TaxID=2742 RepID=UPI001A2420E7
AEYGRFDVYDSDGGLISTLYPEKRRYMVQRNTMTEAGIDGGLFRDIFVAIGERVSDDAWAIRLQYKPLVRWLWLGALFMAAGGFLAISDRRYRIRDKVAENGKVKAPNAGGERGADPVGAAS